MLTLAEARAQVQTNVGASLDPALTDAEIDAILAASVRGAVWAASTAYAVGTLIRPTARTGHLYRVITAGTSSSTEPTWGTADYGTTADGTVTWQEAGPDSAELYDLRQATWDAYQLKLTKAQNYLTVGGDGQTVNLQQIVDNLERRARRWQPVSLA